MELQTASTEKTKMSILESIKVIPQGEVAVVVFDLVGEKVNKLSTPVMTRLREVIQDLKKSTYRAVIFKSGKEKIFIAGADIEEIKSLSTKEQVDKAVSAGQSIFNELEDLPMPTIAAIHGACAGGGCEFVLACDYRIASEDSSTRIGLPETKLGIIPGFGGCVRLPRVIGIANALDVILAGKLLNPKKAKSTGLVDKVVHPDMLEEFSLKFAKDIIAKGGKKRPKQFAPRNTAESLMNSFVGKPLVFSQAKKTVLSKTHGHYPAVLKAIEVVKKTYGMRDREQALQIERHAFSECALTDVSKNLIHVFYLMEGVKKTSGVVGSTIKGKEVKKLGVLGAGTMGGGIAYVAADKGIEVRMKDISWDAVGLGLAHAREIWEKLLKRKSIDSYELSQKINRISGALDWSGFKNCDLVVEAIVENMDVKKKVIAECASMLKEDAIIVTNTSSLSVAEMAQAHPRPENFAGMHFFNPVNMMPLVEVIRGPQTSDETVITVFEAAKKMGKLPVVVKDGPGFLVNRLLLPYMAEALFLLQEGMDIHTVDSAYVKEFGMPMGPFALMDEVGLDVCVKVLKIFKKAFGARIETAPCMEKLESSGRLGKKNQKGFYLYDERRKSQGVDEKIYSELGLPKPSNPLTKKECLERGIFAMINECSLALLEDRIVDTAQEVDLAMITGTGFPPFRGGLLKYADAVSAKYIADQLELYAQKGRARLKPAAPLNQMAKTNRKFYQN